MQTAYSVRWVILPLAVLSSVLGGCAAPPANAPDPTGQVETTAALLDTVIARAEQQETVPSLTPSHTATPTTVPQPTSQTDADWDIPPIDTLCLEVDQVYPELDEEFSQPIRDTAEIILTAMGLTVVGDGGDCEATLILYLEGESVSVDFSGGWVCYNGAEYTGQAVLAVNGEEPVARPITGISPFPNTVYSDSCKRGPADAPWERAWQEVTLHGLASFWGPLPLTTTLELPPQSFSQGVAVVDTAVKLEADHALEVLGQALTHQEFYIREEAAQALGDYGPEVVPLLIQALDDDYSGVRDAAGSSLARIGPEAMEAVPALIVQGRNEDGTLRYRTAVVLHAITGQDLGEGAASWYAWWNGWDLPPIETLCLEIDQTFPQIDGGFSLPVRATVETILTEMGLTVVEAGGDCDETMRLSLTGEALSVSTDDAQVCYNGAEISGRVDLTVHGEYALSRSISGENSVSLTEYGCMPQPANAPWERAWAGALLNGLAVIWGPFPLITTLEQPSLSSNRNMIGAVIDTTMLLFTDKALVVLEQGIKHQDSYVRQEAARVLEGMGSESVPVLLRAFNNQQSQIRQEAANTLGKIGPEAVEAVPALIGRLSDEDEDENVRYAAEVALQAITGQDFGRDVDAWQSWWEGQISQ